MTKLVVLDLGEGSLESGFSNVRVNIFTEGKQLPDQYSVPK